MRRVLVIGAGGSGKSRLATRLGETTGLPVIHLDALYWRPGWVATPETEWQQKIAELASTDRWIMDGNYGGTLELRLASCDTVVFLDLPRRITIPRVILRWLRHRGSTRPEMAPDCPERLTWEFLVWIWSYPRRRRPQVLRKLSALSPDQSVRVLRSRRDVTEFLAGVQETWKSHD